MPRLKKDMTDESAAGLDRFLESLRPDLLDQGSAKSAQVYGLVRQAIVQLLLPPGAPINERMICERLGISRTPLREAILQLAAENLVSVIPDTATRVAPIHLQDVFDGQIVRDALEMKLVRLAATRMTTDFQQRLDNNMEQQKRSAADRDFDSFYELDEEFHRLITECGSSLKVWKIINGAKAQLDRVRRLVFPVNNHLDIVLGEHLDILDGLTRRNEQLAGAAMQAHLDRVFDTIQILIVQKREYFSSHSVDNGPRAEGLRHG